MSMHLFYQPDLESNQITLSEEESKHAIRVLRLNKSDQIEMIDGKGIFAIGIIIDANPKKAIIELVSKELKPQSFSYNLHLLVAPAKNPDRNDWLIEKATETGFNKISFIETEKSERSKINIDRLTRIAINAMKQSKQFYLPEINEIKPFQKVISSLINPKEFRLIAYCNADKSQSIHKLLSDFNNQELVIAIGPEGDFTSNEIELAETLNFKQVSLGNTILRTETAALCAAMSVRALYS